MNALTATDVSRRYGDATVVSNVSLSLAPGKITALLGGSGAGKSTLLRLFAGLEPVDAGEILIGETALSTPAQTTRPEKRRIGLIFQDFALFPHMTAEQNVMFGLADRPAAEKSSIARDWLDRMNLSARTSAYPHELSGGEQQRVAIARALAPGPAAILMDEPFSGLDPALRGSVRDLALSAIGNASIPALLVTHDAEEALSSAHHLAIMHQGHILQHGPPGEVYDHPVSETAARALGPLNKLAIADLPGTLRPADAAATHMFVRPENVILDPSAETQATVLAAAINGPLLSLRLQVGDTELQCLAPRNNQISPGSTVGIKLQPQSLFIFPSDEV